MLLRRAFTLDSEAAASARLLKAWEVAFARHHGFTRTWNCRKRFRAIRSEPDYYSDPADSMVVMELRLAPGSKCD